MASPRVSLIIEDGSTEREKIQHRRHFSSPAKLDSLSREITPENHEGTNVKGSVPMVGSLVYFRPKSLPCSDRNCAVHNNQGKSDKFRRYSSSALSRSSSSSCLGRCEHHVKLTPLEDHHSEDDVNDDDHSISSSLSVSQHLAQYHLGEESPNPSVFEAEVGPRSISANDLHSIGGSLYKEGTRQGTLFDFVDSKVERDRRKSFCGLSSLITSSSHNNRLTPNNTHQPTSSRANRHRRRLTCAMVFEEPKVVEI